MRGVFDDEEPDDEKSRRDTELTLGSTTLLVIFFGLVLLCGLCFGLGFAVGRRGASDTPAAGQGAGAQPASAATASKAKPSATAPITPQLQPQRTTVNLPVESSDSAPAAGAAGAESDGSSAQVKPALTPAPYQPVAQPDDAARVAPAMTPGPALMVQIAAVSHPEDADVLVGALRKRGYAVSVRRLPADNLIHVQIGPFGSRDEAYRWRQKLLNDGYNAIVEP